MSDIKFPLNVGNPCVFYPTGVREAGHGNPCLMLFREGDDWVRLIEIRGGTSVEHRAVRHVDDPFFVNTPGHRAQGAWDYSLGLVYNFKPTKEVKPLPEDATESLVVQLAAQGKSPGQIAGQISTKGWNTTRIQEFLESRSAS
jgi:hypothetical protein